MKKLLFLPLDIEVPKFNFSIDDKFLGRQLHWNVHTVLNEGGNYNNFNWLIDNISLERITLFLHKIQTKKVDSHLDMKPLNSDMLEEYKHTVKHEPAGFHILLNGKNDSLEIYTGSQWVTPILPKVPCVYLLNLTSCWHRVKEDPNRETFYIQGYFNTEKHTKLIERNLKIYSDLAIYEYTGV